MQDTTLKLVQLEPRDEGGVTYPPFAPSDDYEYDWSDFLTNYDPDEDFFFAVFDGEQEVGRAAIVFRELGEGYDFQQPAGSAVVEFLEVAASRRGRGIGSQFVSLLVGRFPGKTLLALSESDGFWETLQWKRHEHAEGVRYRALYVHHPESE